MDNDVTEAQAAMHGLAAETMPRPRSRRRWLIVAAAVVALVGALWWLAPEDEAIPRAKRIRLGMTEQEVLSIMGPHTDKFWWRHDAGIHLRFGNRPAPESWLVSMLGFVRDIVHKWSPFEWRPYLPRYDWPVEIDLDRTLRVSRIERGAAVIKAR